MAHIDKAIGFYFAAALLSAPPAGAAPPTDTEQDQIAAAVFDYALIKDTYFSENAPNFDLYLSVRGKDPSAEFSRSTHVSTDRFHPESTEPPASQSPTRQTMPIVITNFRETTSGALEGRIGTICGPRCGSISDVTVVKRNGAWVVTSFKAGVAF